MKGKSPYFGFSFKRFIQNLIRKNDFKTYRNSRQYWKITWLVYKSYMFRPENILLIGSHVALCSTLAPLSKQNNETSELHQNMKTLSEKYLKQSLEEAAEEQTYEEVLGMLATDEYLEQLEAAKKVENENQQVYKDALEMAISKNDVTNAKEDSYSVKNEHGMLNQNLFTGFEPELDVNNAHDLFENYKQEITKSFLKNGLLKTDIEIETFKNNVSDLDYNKRILMDQEMLLNQSIVYQIQDFFYSFTQKSTEKDPVLAQRHNKEYLTREYAGNNLYRSFLTKIYDPWDFHMKKYSRLQEKRQSRNIDRRDDDLFNTLFEQEGNASLDEAEFLMEQAKTTNIFIDKLLFMQDEYLESLEEQKKRSHDVEKKFEEIKATSPHYYQRIMEYLHNLKYNGLKNSGELLMIYDMIPNNEKDLKSGFTQFLLKRVNYFKHIINPDKKNNFILQNEALFSKMLDTVSGAKNVLPKYSSYIVMMKKLSEPVNSNQKRSINKRIFRKYNSKITRERLRFDAQSKKDMQGQYEINVTWSFFCELLKKALQTGHIGDSLKLLETIPKEYDVEKQMPIDLGDYVAGISLHHESMAELEENYEIWSKKLIEELEAYKTTEDVNKRKLYEDKIFREALNHILLNDSRLI